LITIGSSAGGIEALRRVLSELPARFPGSIFVAQHLGRRGPSQLRAVLGAAATIPVVAPEARQRIERGTIYVPQADHHLVVEHDFVGLSRGPMQNRQRPSADVLFRSAALAYGPRVVGVVLTGMLSDGAAGLLAIKSQGGLAVVQDPADAAFSGMPSSALRYVEPDHCLPLAKVAPLLVQLVRQVVGDRGETDAQLEAAHSADIGQRTGPPPDGQPSPFTCPECHGVLWTTKSDALPRFRCRVGHGYSIENLSLDQDLATEDALWAAARSLEERAELARNMAEQWRARGAEALVRELDDKAARSEAHASKLRELIAQLGTTGPERS